MSTGSIPQSSMHEYNLSEKIESSMHSSDQSMISNYRNSQKRSQLGGGDSTTQLNNTIEEDAQNIKASYYEYSLSSVEEERFPQILQIGFVNFDGQVALGLICDPGVFQLVDPFCLQAFVALIIPSSLYSFLDHFMFHQNRLIGVN